MSMTGLDAFDRTVQRTNEWVHELMDELAWRDKHKAYVAMKATLHALRDRLTVEETAHLSAQLPMLIRGIYFEGWDPTKVPVKMHRDDFFQRVRQEFPYEIPDGTERLVDVVIEALRRHITEGEWQNVRASLPKDLVAVLP